MWNKRENRVGSTTLFAHFNKAIEILNTLENDPDSDKILKQSCVNIKNQLNNARDSIQQFLNNSRTRGPVGLHSIVKALNDAQQIIHDYRGFINIPYSQAEQYKRLLITNTLLTLLALSILIPIILYAQFVIVVFVALLLIAPMYFEVNKTVIKGFEEGQMVNPLKDVSEELDKLQRIFLNPEINFGKDGDPHSDIFSEPASLHSDL